MARILSGVRCAAVMLLVMMLTMTAQTAWADTWPEYITDIILVGGSSSEVNAAKANHSDYTFISKDLNDNAGGDYIYLGYKKGSRANVNGGYITDIIVVTEGSNPIPTGNISILGRTYNKAAIYGGNRFVNDRKGDLNSGAGGWGLWLYYTKQEYGTTKRAVSEITFNGTSSGSVNCYNLDGSLKQEGINMNRGCSSGDNIYMHLTTTTKTNRPSSDPVMASNLTYDGTAKQLITTAATLASGTMYYRIGTSGEWKTSISELTATNAGGYTVQYYAGSTSYSDASSTHSTTVSIGKSPNNGLTVSCPKVDVGGTLSPSLVGTNLSTGSTTYKYATSQDGDYTTTKPTAGGLYWVKATIAGDTNCDEYTTPAVKTSIAMGNVTVTSSTTEWLDGGTYNVTSDVTISSRIIINGDVTLNLGEGKTLTANKGIELSSGNKLTITGSGTLTATGYANNTPLNGIRYSFAAIGACNFGELVINSGTVNAGNGSPDFAAGIGGSYNITQDLGNSSEGSVTINGGIVNANGGRNAAALGGSIEGRCMKITINGGQVTLRKCSYDVYSYALGRGLDGSSGAKVTVGWTNADDFIDHDGCNQSVSFVSGKRFIREGSTTPATSSEFHNNAGKYVPCFTVTYDTNGGSAVSDTYIGSGSTLTEPATTREGYTLTGWKNGSADFDFSTPIVSDMTLTAQWTENTATLDETIPTGNALASLCSTWLGQQVKVSFTRSFTSGVASTVCLPFPMTDIEGGNVYEFVGVEYDATANSGAGAWVATMIDASPETGNLLSATEANKPYLFMPNATGDVTFTGTIASVPAEITAGSTTSTDTYWTFQGTYSRLAYGTAPFSDTVFGFAASTTAEDKEKGQDAVTAGEFVKAISGAYIPAFRAFLKYSGSDTYLQARGTRGGAGISETITVRLIGKSGEIDGIGEIRLSTGEVTFDPNAWYDLNGRRLAGKPTTKGIYINGGHKVVIK